jgi:Outer membrane lipoprotein-sorting protein
MRPSLLVALCLASALAALGASPSEVQKWLEGVDATRNAFAEAIVSARASHVTSGKEGGSADFDVYIKGRDRSLLVFRGGKNSGRKILTSGAKMWLIVPGARHPLPITPNQRLLGGASFGDVAQLRFAEDFTAVLRDETETIAGRECHILDLTAKSPRSSYPRVTLWLDKAERLPRQVLFFLPSGKAARRVNFTKFDKNAGKTLVAEMEIRELLGRESTAVTRIAYRDYRPARLDDAIFTPEGARGL